MSESYAAIINDRVPLNSPMRQLILAAVMCLDKVVHTR
jgi:hypothetical protein